MQQQQGNPFGNGFYPAPSGNNNPYYQQQQPRPQQQQQQQMPPQMGNPFDPMGSTSVAHEQGAPYNGGGVKMGEAENNPFGMTASPSPYAQQPTTSALVPAAQQSNPYALPPGSSNPFGSPQQPQGGANAGGSGNPFDPFAPPPPPAPAPAPYQQPPPQQQQHHYDDVSHASRSMYVEQASSHTPYDAPPPQQQQPPYSPPPAQQPQYQQQQPPHSEPYQPPAPAPPEPAYSHQQQYHHHHEEPSYDRPSSLQHQPPPRGEADMYDMDSPGGQSTDSRNKYAEELAQNAPPGASPLPKASLVRKKGFVLSRISFRTIVMKKWKQAFWVQYGPHTMLWFRSQADFDDWLNNPYHNQAQRNFLIKLAVNFVHDLYKPSVRGYQVTQCRTKAYGNKMIRQFKLERWMDYGPTIAAASGSYNPKEVDDLREALVECMRNTPLSGGIRATGAVRQNHPTESRPFSYDDHRPNNNDGYNRGGYPNDRDYEESPPPAGNQQQPPAGANGGVPQGADSVAEETDLLDLDNWDDVPGHNQPPGQPQPGASPYHHGPPPAASPYQQGPPPPQSPYQQGPPPPQSPYQQGFPGGYPPQQQQQQQDGNFAGALVPVQPGAPAPYPGAPGYLGSPSPYGAPPTQGAWPGQQQQQPYGQQQAYHQQPGY